MALMVQQRETLVTVLNDMWALGGHLGSKL